MSIPATILTSYRSISERTMGVSRRDIVEEPVMHTRFVLIAAAISVSGTAFAAEPVKPPVQAAVQQQQPAPAQVVLASADDVRVPSATDQQAQSAPKRPRVGRVTTCRCGDPQAQPEQ
jgi:hypothetical protein